MKKLKHTKTVYDGQDAKFHFVIASKLKSMSKKRNKMCLKFSIEALKPRFREFKNNRIGRIAEEAAG